MKNTRTDSPIFLNFVICWFYRQDFFFFNSDVRIGENSFRISTSILRIKLSGVQIHYLGGGGYLREWIRLFRLHFMCLPVYYCFDIRMCDRTETNSIFSSFLDWHKNLLSPGSTAFLYWRNCRSGFKCSCLSFFAGKCQKSGSCLTRRSIMKCLFIARRRFQSPPTCLCW